VPRGPTGHRYNGRNGEVRAVATIQMAPRRTRNYRRHGTPISGRSNQPNHQLGRLAGGLSGYPGSLGLATVGGGRAITGQAGPDPAGLHRQPGAAPRQAVGVTIRCARMAAVDVTIDRLARRVPPHGDGRAADHRGVPVAGGARRPACRLDQPGAILFLPDGHPELGLELRLHTTTLEDSISWRASALSRRCRSSGASAGAKDDQEASEGFELPTARSAPGALRRTGRLQTDPVGSSG
jgi:hypothetical protein